MKSDFLKNYIAKRGFSDISKTEFEKLVFYDLVFAQNAFGLPENASPLTLDSQQIFKIADELRIAPTKVSSLLRAVHQANYADETRSPANAADIICKYVAKDTEGFQAERLELLIVNPVELEILTRFLAERNVRYDSSFNRNLLKIKFQDIDRAFDEADKEKIFKAMKKAAEEKTGKKLGSINFNKNFLKAAKEVSVFVIKTAAETVAKIAVS